MHNAAARDACRCQSTWVTKARSGQPVLRAARSSAAPTSKHTLQILTHQDFFNGYKLAIFVVNPAESGLLKQG
jgi:hypothetical protein